MEHSLALLIDAENVSAKYINLITDEANKKGKLNYRRVYGDWTQPQIGKWKKACTDYALTPVQQFSPVSGKSSSDFSLVIDAMDILNSGKVDGFVIVSSDSDFTKLAMRLREAGMNVIGIGEKKTPEPFIVACDRFIYLEILKEQDDGDAKEGEKKTKTSKTIDNVTTKLIQTLKTTIDDLADDEGWAYLGDVGNLLQKKQPNFDARNYGFQKLTRLIDSTGKFEIQKRENQKGHLKLMYVRNK